MSNRKQRVNVNDAYSLWNYIFYGVLQGSILGPLLFNIYLCDLFYCLKDDIVSYADDTTIYTVNEKKEIVISALETSSSLLLGWFNSNL